MLVFYLLSTDAYTDVGGRERLELVLEDTELSLFLAGSHGPPWEARSLPLGYPYLCLIPYAFPRWSVGTRDKDWAGTS
jgi:hypothetical protein